MLTQAEEICFFESVQAMELYGRDSSRHLQLMYAMRSGRLVMETRKIPVGRTIFLYDEIV